MYPSPVAMILVFHFTFKETSLEKLSDLSKNNVTDLLEH